MSNNYKISVIMPSFLGVRADRTDNLPKKFRRAVNSALNQSYTNFELIIISDGCQETNKILKTEYNQYLKSGKIKLIELPKHEAFDGRVRQTGIDRASGVVLVNLDADDSFLPNHLWNIKTAFDPTMYQWAYFNVYRKLDNLKGIEELLSATPDLDSLFTTNVIWRKDLDVTWVGANGLQDNKAFNKQLLDKYKNKVKLYGCGYVIHHSNISHLESN